MKHINSLPTNEPTGNNDPDQLSNNNSSKKMPVHLSDSLFNPSENPVEPSRSGARSGRQTSREYLSSIQSKSPRFAISEEDSLLLNLTDLIEMTSQYLRSALFNGVQIATPDQYPEFMRSMAIGCNGLYKLIKVQHRMERTMIFTNSHRVKN